MATGGAEGATRTIEESTALAQRRIVCASPTRASEPRPPLGHASTPCRSTELDRCDRCLDRPGKTAPSRASPPKCGRFSEWTSCSTANSSIRPERHRLSSKTGEDTTQPSDLVVHRGTGLRHLKPSSPWNQGRSCTKKQAGPVRSGSPSPLQRSAAQAQPAAPRQGSYEPQSRPWFPTQHSTLRRKPDSRRKPFPDKRPTWKPRSIDRTSRTLVALQRSSGAPWADIGI
jgi:hypothetical protein